MQKSNTNTDTLLTTDEVAAWLRVTRFTIYRCLKRGMPHYRLGAKHLFKRAEVEAWMKTCADGSDDGAPKANHRDVTAFRSTPSHTMSLEETNAKLAELVP